MGLPTTTIDAHGAKGGTKALKGLRSISDNHGAKGFQPLRGDKNEGPKGRDEGPEGPSLHCRHETPSPWSEGVPTPSPRLDLVALRIRALELLLLDLHRADRIGGTVHTCVGQEYTAACLHPHLRPGHDVFVGSHRAHGHYVASGEPIDALLAELMGRDDALCLGRGGSQHLHSRTFFSSGIQGGGALWATGLAWAQAFDHAGGVVVAQLGDGTLGEGAVYEAFTFAAIRRAPILFYLEWNGWAQSTDTSLTTPGDILTRARGFGLEAHRCDDRDPEALSEHLGTVVARVRTGIPTLQIVDTRRLLAHSKGDDYRPPDTIERLRRDDPLSCRLEQDASLRAQFIEIQAELRDLAERVWKRRAIGGYAGAEAGERAAGAEAPALHERDDHHHAGAEAPALHRGLTVPMERRGFNPFAGPAAGTQGLKPLRSIGEVPMERRPFRAFVAVPPTIRDALNQALHAAMDADERVLMLGQDLIDPYGGAFKITRGLSTRFPDRVISTPVAEAGLVGVCNGLALAGWRPIAEIMFADFATLACDQLINHAAKFRYMYGDRVTCPIVVRLVSGGGRGYGPTHSQSLEHLFLGVPGLCVVALSGWHDPSDLVGRIVAHNSEPLILVEHKQLYTKPPRTRPPLDLELQLPVDSTAPFPPLVYHARQPSATLVTCGGCTTMVEEAIEHLFVEYEVECDVIVLTQLWPLDVADVVASVARTGRLIVVEEGGADYGVGAAVVASVAHTQPVQCRTVGSAPLPIPSARHLERQVLPSSGDVVIAVLELL